MLPAWNLPTSSVFRVESSDGVCLAGHQQISIANTLATQSALLSANKDTSSSSKKPQQLMRMPTLRMHRLAPDNILSKSLTHVMLCSCSISSASSCRAKTLTESSIMSMMSERFSLVLISSTPALKTLDQRSLTEKNLLL